MMFQPKPISGWNDNAKWAATNPKSKGWGDSSDSSTSAEEKKVSQFSSFQSMSNFCYFGDAECTTLDGFVRAFRGRITNSGGVCDLL